MRLLLRTAGIMASIPDAGLAQMLASPKIGEAWAKQGADAVTMTPEQVTGYLRSDIAKLGKLVKAAGAKVD